MGMALTRLPLVAFNAQLASGTASYRSAGISAYIVNLLRSLSRQAVEWRSIVFWGAEQFPADVPLPFRRSSLPTYHPLVRIFWEQVLLPLALQRLHAALLHAPAFVGPLASPCPQVITIHDLSFLRYPQFFRRSNRLYLRWMTGIACRRAAGVIAVSQFTAREVTDLLGVPSERVHTIYHGVESRFQPLSFEEVARFRQEQGLPERFILHLGTLEPRKNLLTLVRAFARLHDSEVHLVLAGGKGWFYEDIFAEVERLGLQDRVHFPGYVSAESQVLWYNAATAFAYLSHYEGFGLPVLEALACGIPTVTGDATSLPEVAGDGALTVDAENVAAVAEGLHRLLTDTALREMLRERGLRHAGRFTWEETARQTSALYTSLLEKPRTG